MNKISRRNLQEFCRTCLSSLTERRTFIGIGGETPKYELSFMPQLRKLLIVFTSLRTFDDVYDGYDYPQKLCQLCYDKLQDFEEFRRMILESAQKIEHILQNEEFTSPLLAKTTSKSNNKLDNSNDCSSDDDDKLLIPELAADWNPNANVKIEPEEFDDDLAEETNANKSNDTSIKNEIDSEYDQDNSSCQYYEQNALNLFGAQNDKDDKKHNILNELYFSASFKGFKSGGTKATRKRDRNKKCLKCPRCDKQVYKKVYLDAHIRAIHEGHEKPFLCSECQKSFTRYNQLHVHMQTNHTLIKFVCGIAGCSATFKMNKTLETHRKVVHTEDMETGAPIELDEIIAIHQQQLVDEWEMEHFCNECGKKYSSKRALVEHLKRHSKIREHVCQVCGVAKVTRTELVTHMRTHDTNLEKFKCTICPQEFNHKNAISRHIRVVHEGERRFTCNYCPRRFGTRHAKTSHERLHTGERPFKCDFCPKGFAQIEGLKSHMKNHDKSLRKHVCKFCSQRFITRKNLIDHEQRHLGSKPHICMVCSRGFFNPEDLDLHKKIHEEENKSLGNNKTDDSNNDTEEDSVLGVDQGNGVDCNQSGDATAMTEENYNETCSDDDTDV